MTEAIQAPIGSTATWRGPCPAMGGRHLRRLLGVFLLLLCSLVVPRNLRVSTLAVALLLAPLPSEFGHDRLGVAGPVDLSTLDAADHGHSHGGDGGDGSPVGHLHGDHDPADHSHQLAFFAPSVSLGALPLPERWPSRRTVAPDQAAGFGIDRPPKRTLSL